MNLSRAGTPPKYLAGGPAEIVEYLDRMARFRKGMDQHGAMRILRAIYLRDEYAKYVTKSRVAHRYKAIAWGRGV